MDNNRSWNHPPPDPRLHLENGPFVLPSENTALSGVNSMASFNFSLRSNDHRLLSSEVPNYREANTGASHGPYPHPSSAGSSSRAPRDYVHHPMPSYDRYRSGGMSSTVYPQMDHGRAPLKRKTPDFAVAFDGGSSSRYYSTESSSSLHVSGPQPRDLSSIGPAPGYVSNSLSVSGDGSQRNVRSRHGLNPSGTRPSSNMPHHSSTVNSYGPVIGGPWSYAPVSSDSIRTLPSDIRIFGHEINRPGISNMEVDGGYHSNQILSRNPSTPLPTPYGPSTRGSELGHGYYGQRTNPYRAIPTHRPRGSAANSEDGRQPGVAPVGASRHPRPAPILGRSGERAGRARNTHQRFQSASDGDHTRNGWISEGVIVIDHSTLYDSRALFNQHHDIGLDVDNMSYEELLALEERIGNVSTGLSEGLISVCVTEMMHRSDQIHDDDEEERNCPICLEEYNDEDGLGRLNCRHDFHFGCIKKWLMMKNACPICKASALEK